MNEFPQALYIMPGVEKLESGLFTTQLVKDAEQRDAALADGWHTCQEDAKAAFEADEAERIAAALKAAEPAASPVVSKSDLDDDNAPPTRAELEQKATELGVEFSPNIGDKKLAERIAVKLAEQGA